MPRPDTDPGVPGVARPVTPALMLRRGLTRRCPFCGNSGIFDGWFKLRDHCPGCNHRFHQEDGFFLGAYAINFAITEGLLLLTLIPYILMAASRGADRPSALPFAAAAVVAAIVGPVLFYPFSRSLWIALDMTLRGGRNLPDPGSD